MQGASSPPSDKSCQEERVFSREDSIEPMSMSRCTRHVPSVPEMIQRIKELSVNGKPDREVPEECKIYIKTAIPEFVAVSREPLEVIQLM